MNVDARVGRSATPRADGAARRLQALERLSDAVAQAPTGDAVLRAALEVLAGALEAAGGVARAAGGGLVHVIGEATRVRPGVLDEAARRMAPAGADQVLGLPLVADGACLGVLGLAWAAPRRLDDGDRAFLRVAANACAQAKGRLTLARAARHAALRRGVLARLAAALAVAGPEVDEVLRVLAAEAQAALGGRCVATCTDGRIAAAGEGGAPLRATEALRASGEAIGTLEIRRARPLGAEERELAAELAERAASALAAARHEETLRLERRRMRADRARAEEALALRERVLESMSEGVCLADAAGRIVYANPAQERMFGCRPGELLGRHVAEFGPRGADGERLFADVRDVVGQDRVWVGELPNRRADGTPFVTCARVRAVELGGYPHTLVVQQDLTERRRAEASAEAIRQRVIALFTQVRAIVIMLSGPEHVVDFANPTAARFVGGRPLVGRPLATALEGLGEAHLARLSRVLRTGERFAEHEYELRYAFEPGGAPEDRFLDIVFEPIRGPDGAVEGVMIFGFDVTGLVAARRRAENLADALRRSEETFRTMAESLPQMVWTGRPDGYIDYANSRWIAYTGLDLVATQGAGWSAALHHEDRDAALMRWMESVRSGEPYEVVYRLRQAGGGYRWFIGRALPLRARDGRIVRWCGTFTDIHDQKRIEEERASLLERERAARGVAEAASRAKDEFLAMLGHELRNPLAPIATALELMKLRTGGVLDHEQAVIERQVRHLQRLVDDLLDVSRITRGKIQLRKGPVEVQQVVAKAVEIASPLYEQRRHALAVEVPPGLRVEGDEVRLAQVVANLLTNAARYTDPGGHVRVWASREGDEIVIGVRDDGLGIPEDMLPRLFDLFVQGARSPDRAEGGLGIGLTVVKNLVQLHGGQVFAHSDGPGKGSEFLVKLPALASAAPEAALAAPGRPRRRVTGRRVLIVDDNEDAAELLGEMLSTLGHAVEVAADGPQALLRLERFRPEIAVLDIGLPVMDGYELASKIRARLGETAPEMVALTGYGQEHDRARSLRAGFRRHFVKPVDTDALISFIDDPGA